MPNIIERASEILKRKTNSAASGQISAVDLRKERELEHLLWKDKGWTFIQWFILLSAFFGGAYAGIALKEERARTAGFAATSACIGAIIQKKASEPGKTSVD
jgi:hypothetical protein